MSFRTICFLSALLLPAISFWSPAKAEEARIENASAVAEARERFARGVQLYREGSLEAALAEFEKAAQIAPSYRLQYNIAQVQYELHNYVAAMRAYRRYLAYGGDQIPAARRAKVQSDIAELEGRVAQLTVKTNVPGAVVAIDEIRAGVAPLTRPLWVNPGLRRVSALKPGYLPATVTVTAAGGEQIDLNLELPPLVSPGTARQLGVQATADEPARPRVKTWLSLLTTGALAATTGGFALLTRDAKRDFEVQLDQIPNTRASIENARLRMVTFAAVTDALAVGTLIAGGVAIYMALTEGRPPNPEPTVSRRTTLQLSLGATPGGLLATGRF
jgi:tetratricopeptide (TPR) repeat protein